MLSGDLLVGIEGGGRRWPGGRARLTTATRSETWTDTRRDSALSAPGVFEVAQDGVHGGLGPSSGFVWQQVEIGPGGQVLGDGVGAELVLGPLGEDRHDGGRAVRVDQAALGASLAALTERCPIVSARRSRPRGLRCCAEALAGAEYYRDPPVECHACETRDRLCDASAGGRARSAPT